MLKRSLCLAGLAVLAGVVLSTPVSAHPTGVTVTDIYIGAARVEVVYTVPTSELWRVAGGERPESPRPARAYEKAVRDGFSLSDDGEPCRLQGLQSTRVEDIRAYQYRLRFACPRPLERLRLSYGLFVDFDRGHRNIARAFAGEMGMRAVLSHGRREMEIPVARLLAREGFSLPELPARPAPPSDTSPAAGAFFGLGVEHILTGYDHLLFLGGLILVTLRFSSLAVLVTAFTLAHSVSLALAALGVVVVPPAVTESLIALSVAWVGALNAGAVWRRTGGSLGEARRVDAFRAFAAERRRGRWMLTFAFGLVHGLGFAGILRQVGLPEGAVASALALFNVGVETGQLAVVALVYPLLRVLARTRAYPAAVLAASLALTAVGAVWFWLRATA